MYSASHYVDSAPNLINQDRGRTLLEKWSSMLDFDSDDCPRVEGYHKRLSTAMLLENQEVWMKQNGLMPRHLLHEAIGSGGTSTTFTSYGGGGGGRHSYMLSASYAAVPCCPARFWPVGLPRILLVRGSRWHPATVSTRIFAYHGTGGQAASGTRRGLKPATCCGIMRVTAEASSGVWQSPRFPLPRP